MCKNVIVSTLVNMVKCLIDMPEAINVGRPRPESGRQLFLDGMRQRNKINGNKPPPQQYQQRLSNSSL